MDIPEREYISNDDPKKLGFPIEDEDANPYEVIVKAGLSHGIGEITSFDAPIFMAFASDPSVGSSLAQVANFREFARLEIKDSIEKGLSDRFWYRISKYQKWHHVWSATYGEFPPASGSLVWTNNSSSSGSFELVILNE